MNMDKGLWERAKTLIKLVGSGIIRFFYLIPVATESLVIYDGEVVTILGFINYNKSFDCFEIDNPLAIFMGGRDEII